MFLWFLFANSCLLFLTSMVSDTRCIIIIIIGARSNQPEPPAVAIVRQNGLSSASSRASVADTPVSRQICWTQVGPADLSADGRPQGAKGYKKPYRSQCTD